MIYSGKYKNIDNETIVITITTKEGTGGKELLLAENAVTITSTSEGLFSPIKADSATVRVLTDSIYSDIYSSKYDSTIEITNETKGRILFRGFITPNVYNQEYVGLDELEIEAVSAISTLKHIKYKRTTNIIGWYDLIKNALTSVGYDKFYFADSYKIENKDNFLKELYQFEGNFFDDDEEETPWTYYDILEEFCKYFCLSLVVYQGEVYFIDYYNLNRYIEFNLKDDTYIRRVVLDQQTIKADSYKGTGANISFDETFNKVEVKDNLYEFNNVVPNPFDKLKNQNADENKYYIQTMDKEENGETVNYTYLNGFFKSEDWDTSQTATEITPDNITQYNNTSFFQKVSSYKTEEEPSSLSWTDYLTAYSIGDAFIPYTDFIIAKPKVKQDMVCNGGYFIMNMDYFLSNNVYANDCFETSDQKYSDSKFANPLEDTRFPCRLYIGEYYYDGENWIHKDEYWRKVTKDYYKVCFITSMHDIPTWYKYKDADGDWVFCNKETWDKQTGVKENGKVSNSNFVYYFNGETGSINDRIYVDEPFYNECYLQDRFYLVHKNKVDDKIFNDVKKLTNTVSWRMNIVDSEDGVAIKLPSFLLSGKLQFEIYSPYNLGDYGQYRTDMQVEKVTSIHINKLELVYKVTNTQGNIYDGTTTNDDVLYTNVIDESYVNEWDDMELKINTQVENRITSLSSVLIKSIDKYIFLEKVHDNKYNEDRIQEENIIIRYYNHYNTPKVILQACLDNTFKPTSLVTENNLKKLFIVDSYELDVQNNSVNVKLIEL